MKRNFFIRLIVGALILESIFIFHLVLRVNEVGRREQYLIEQNTTLHQLRNEERRIYELQETTFMVCSSLMKSTFSRLGLVRPGGVGEAVMDALSIQTGGSR